MSEINKDWLTLIHNSHHYFCEKMSGINPNKLLLHPVVRTELRCHALDNHKVFLLCDLYVTEFMGVKVIETKDVKDFLWVFAVEE